MSLCLDTAQPLQCPDAEAMANKLAELLPDVDKINAMFDAGELQYAKSIGHWEQPIIIERAWNIWRTKNHDAKR